VISLPLQNGAFGSCYTATSIVVIGKGACLSGQDYVYCDKTFCYETDKNTCFSYSSID